MLQVHVFSDVQHVCVLVGDPHDDGRVQQPLGGSRIHSRSVASVPELHAASGREHTDRNTLRYSSLTTLSPVG